MSFFNSLHFLIEIGFSTALFIGLVRLFPRIRPEYPLLALCLYWTYSFLNVPVYFVAGWSAFLVVFFYLVKGSAASKFPRLGMTSLILMVVLIWMAKRFPLTMNILHLPSVGSSDLLKHEMKYLVGVPFTMCRLASFVIDITKGKFTNPSLIKFLLYIFYFPTRISGPVTSYGNFEIQVWRKGEWQRYMVENLWPGSKRIILGVLKREVVSEVISAAALPFMILDHAGRWQLIFGAYCYYFYLYIDFSGYSDLAVGFSKVLGITIPENFDKPFLSRNPKEFWRRWHISLLNWLNEYVLTPMYSYLLLKFPKAPPGLLSFVAIFATMGFAGIWHGEEERYLFYGIFNAFILWLYRSYDNYMRVHHAEHRRIWASKPWVIWGSRFLCFHYVVFAFMIFSVEYDDLIVILGRIWHG